MNATETRQALGLSKYAIAKAIGCSWAHYHLYERGERKLSAAKLAALTDLFAQATAARLAKAQQKPTEQ